MPKSLSLAKITRPRVKGLLSRERLFSRLDTDAAPPVTWVCGPGGSGKTALLSSYIEARKRPVLWYRLDGGDSDPASFFYYLGLAAKKAAPRQKRPLPLLTPEYLPALPVFSRNFFRNLYSRLKPPYLIVIDDYHRAPAGSVLDEILVQAFLEIPEGIQVAVLSRQAPPAALSRMRMNETLALFDWDMLRFTVEETGTLVHAKKGKDAPKAETVRRLHERTKGWVAGLLLILRSKEGIGNTPDSLAPQSSEALFDYFAGEVLREIDADVHTFLNRTAYLPRMTAEMAGRVSRSKNAKEILRRLTRGNFFTERDNSEVPVYRYHDLFREYLLTNSKETINQKEQKTHIHLSASTLEAQGWTEDALSLFMTAEDWPKSLGLLLNIAPVVAGQGRFLLLNQWLTAFPEKMTEENPWLVYWQGVCALVADLEMAKKLFAQAYERFKERGDTVGLFLAWSGVAEAIFFEWSDFTQMDRWINEIDYLFETDPVFPSKEIELRVMTNFVIALSYRTPQHPKRLILVKRLQELVYQPIDNNLRVMALTILCWNYHIIGVGEMENTAGHELKQLLDTADIQPLQKTFAYATEIFVAFLKGDYASGQKAIEAGLAIANESGVHFSSLNLYLNGAIGAIVASDLETAEAYLKEAEALLDHRKLNVSYYHFVCGLAALARRQYARALTEAELAMKLTLEAGTPFSEFIDSAHISQILIEQGKFEKAEAEQLRGIQIAKQHKSAHFEYIALLLQSQLEMAKGKEGDGIKHLQRAFILAREGSFFIHVSWYAPAMARLCAKALEAGIEVDYVQSMIRKYKLIPDQPPLDIVAWPWKIKVTTLGSFSVEIAGKPLHFKRKTRQKPLDLLKTLIALGGDEVKEESLADILWPETDGDKALQAVATNLHRLRELIGQDAVTRKKRRLSLNRSILWCDVWALARLIENRERAKTEDSKNKAFRRIMSLYAGPFLEEVLECPEVMCFRDTVNDQLQKCLFKEGARLIAAGRHEAAISIYQKGVMIDGRAGIFLPGLMNSCHALGRLGEARMHYHRYRRDLKEAYGEEPAKEIRMLYKKLSAS